MTRTPPQLQKTAVSDLLLEQIPASALNNFLYRQGLYRSFSQSRKPISAFLSGCLSENTLDARQLDAFFFDALAFGKNKAVFLARLTGAGYVDLASLLKRTQALYGASDAFLDIAGNPLQKPQDELAALQWVANQDGTLLQLSLLFGKRIPVTKNGRLITKLAYFPVEIHFPSGEIILKANRNIEGIKEKPYTYTSLALEHLERVAQLLQRPLAATNIENLRKMYEVSRYLTHRYFQAVSEEQGEPLQGLIDGVASQIENGIRIDGLTEKTRLSDIFDIRKNVRYIIENAKLFDYITTHPDQRPILSRLDGFLTYIKYEDRDAYLIRFRGANYTRDLSNSETFLRLRGDLEKYKEISTIQVFWYREHGDYENKFRVRYEVFTPEVLALYFYSELNEDDFRDAVEKFNRYGKGGTA